MKFLLLRPKEQKICNEGSFYPASIHPPLDLLYIGAALEHDGHKAEIIDFNVENITHKHLVNSLMLSDAVGISVYTNNCKTAANIANEIRETDSNIPIIIGGPHCTFFQKHSLTDIPKADISVVGEGENVIVDIAHSLQGRKNLSDISGIFYRKNTIIKSGNPLQVIDDLDSIVFPARHLVEKYDYGASSGFLRMFKKKFTTMMTSRGCPSKCSFCAQYGNIIKNYGFRERSAENVVGELQEINEKYGSVMIIDDNFLADAKRAHKIFDMLLERGTELDLLILGARVDSADKKLYTKMKEANVKFVGFGIESGNQDVLDFYNKKVTLNQIRNALKLAKEMKFLTYGSFILGAPIETKKHIEKTIKFACSLPIDIADFGPLVYQMGSSLWNDAVKNNKISINEYLVTADFNRNLGNFTAEELHLYVNKAFRRFYLRPSYILDQIHIALSKKEPSIIINGLKFITSI